MSNVNLAEMHKIGQLFDRQKGYLVNGQTFVSVNCRPAGYTGVLSLLEGHYRRCYDAGTIAMDNGVKISDKCSSTIKSNYAQYVANDRAAYEALHKFDKNAPPYQAPRGQLGPGGTGNAPPPGGGDGSSVPGKVWDGTKWVLNKATDARADWSMTKGQRRRYDQQQKYKDTKSQLPDGDTSISEDPKGYVTGKIREKNEKFYLWVRQHATGQHMSPEEYERYLQKKRHDALDGGGTDKKSMNRMNTVVDAIQKPGEVIDEAKGVWDAGKKIWEESERGNTIRELEQVDNTGSRKWANDKGGTW